MKYGYDFISNKNAEIGAFGRTNAEAAELSELTEKPAQANLAKQVTRTVQTARTIQTVQAIQAASGKGRPVEAFSHAAMQMLILFAIVAFGFLARKLKLMNDAFDTMLSKLVMTITLPAMILNSVLSNTDLPSTDQIFIMLGLSVVVFGISSLFAWVFVKLVYRRVAPDAQGAHMFVIAFGNTGFIGFAVIEALLGSDSVLYGAIFNIPFNLFLFSVGVLFIASTGTNAANQKQSLGDKVRIIVKQLISPCLISCLIAVFLAIFHITDSGFVGSTCSLLGQMTVPAAMLVTGSNIAKMPLKDMVNDGWSYLTAAMRLLVVPLGLFVLMRPFCPDPYLLAIAIILAAMPAATVGTMFCLAYGGDTKAMARATFLTTVLSIITIPLVTLVVL